MTEVEELKTKVERLEGEKLDLRRNLLVTQITAFHQQMGYAQEKLPELEAMLRETEQAIMARRALQKQALVEVVK